MRKRTLTAGATAVALVAGGIGVAVAAPAFAHTPAVQCTPDGLAISLTDYQVKPATPGKDAVPAVPAVYGDAPIITPAVPAQPEVPAVTEVQNRYVKHGGLGELWLNSVYKYALEDGTSSNVKPPKGVVYYERTSKTRTVVITPAIPAVPGKDAVYGEPPLITPAVPEQPAVPAVPGDDEPNSVSTRIESSNGGSTTSDLFGTTYVKTIPFDDPTLDHTYTVDVVAWDDPDGTNGWTKQFTGTCEGTGATTPPVTETPTPTPTTPPVTETPTPTPTGTPTPTTPPVTETPTPTPTATTPVVVTPKPTPTSDDTCATVGATNIHKGDPLYTVSLDGDQDGVACETVTPVSHDNNQPPTASNTDATLAYTGAQISPWTWTFIALALSLGIGGLVLGPRLHRRFKRQ